jgi:hypothetical protein
MKNEEVNDGVPIETTLAGNLEETVDVEVTRIAAEKRSYSGGRGKSSHDAEVG